MPQPATLITQDDYLRVLLLGAAKIGKSTCSIVSLCKAFGEGYVLCCGDRSGMAPAARQTKKFTYDLIRDERDIEAGLKIAREGVKKGEFHWVFVDDFSLYASFLEGELRDASAANSESKLPDGRRYWPEYKQRLLNVVGRLFDLKTHIIFASHYIEASQEIKGQRPKSGQGIMPMIGGSAREELPARFQDVLFMEKEKDRRVFQVNPEGIWGPGCRNVDGTHTIDADFGQYFDLMRQGQKLVKLPRKKE